MLRCERKAPRPPADTGTADQARETEIEMKTLVAALVGLHKNSRVVAAALVAAGVLVGWGLSNTMMARATTSDALSRAAIAREHIAVDGTKPSLIGTYQVTGTDTEGKPYAAPSIVDISLAPSGALELDWDNGKQVGVGQVVGNVLAVACLTKGRTAVLVMNINPDGSLSGRWLRGTDRGYKGTEMWKKALFASAPS